MAPTPGLVEDSASSAERALPNSGGPGPGGPRVDGKPGPPGRQLPGSGRPAALGDFSAGRRAGRPPGGGAGRRPAVAVWRAMVPLRVRPRRAGRPGRSRWLGRVRRRGDVRGRVGGGPAPQGRRRGLPQPRCLPHRGRPRPASRARRLSALDDGLGDARR